MRFRYTFEKDFKRETIVISLIVMHVYFNRIDKGYKVVKREVFMNDKWEEII